MNILKGSGRGPFEYIIPVFTWIKENFIQDSRDSNHGPPEYGTGVSPTTLRCLMNTCEGCLHCVGTVCDDYAGDETRNMKLTLFVAHAFKPNGEGKQAVSCSGSLREGPIHFYSNGIISHSKIFRRGYLRKITFFLAEGRQRRNRQVTEDGIRLKY